MRGRQAVNRLFVTLRDSYAVSHSLSLAKTLQPLYDEPVSHAHALSLLRIFFSREESVSRE